MSAYSYDNHNDLAATPKLGGSVTHLRARRTEVWNRAYDLAKTAADEGRSLTWNEQGTFESLNTELADIDARIGAQLDAEKRAKEADESFARIERTPQTRPFHENRDDARICDEFRRVARTGSMEPIDVRSPNPRSYYQPGLELRALSKGSATMTPTSLYDRIVETVAETSAVLNAGATLITSQTGESLVIPKSTGFSTAAIVTEGSAISASDPALGQVSLGAYKYALLITVSRELLDDTSVDLTGYLAREAGTAIGIALGNHLINGNGTGQPRGVILDASVGVTGPTGTATSFGGQGTSGQGTDLLNSLYGSVLEPYASSPAAAFLMRNATLTSLRNLKATTGELVGPVYLANAPARVLMDPNVPAMAANAKSVLFGDWSRYFVRMVNGIRFERSDDYTFNTDQVTFRCILRADGALIDTAAIKWLANSAT